MSPASISPPAAASRGARLWRHAWQLTTCHSIGFLLWGFSWEDKIEQAEGQLLAVIMIDALLGIAGTQLILLRRRRPVGVAAVLIVAHTFSSWAMPATAVAIISVAARRRRGEIAALGALWLVSGVANDLVLAREVGASESLIQQGLLGSSTLVLVWMLVYAVLVSVGWNRGARAEIMESWRVGAELARREQVARVAQAQTAERARIAREMHDVLAHKISLISLHAGVLSYQDGATTPTGWAPTGRPSSASTASSTTPCATPRPASASPSPCGTCSPVPGHGASPRNTAWSTSSTATTWSSSRPVSTTTDAHTTESPGSPGRFIGASIISFLTSLGVGSFFERPCHSDPDVFDLSAERHLREGN